MMRPIKAIVMRNLLKLSRDKMRLFFMLFMTASFLFMFSFVTRATVTHISNPLSYLLSGIIILTVFQNSLSNSMNILEDISSGFMKEILVAPIKRWQIAIGQVFSATIVSVIQGFIIIIAGLFMGLKVDLIHGVLMILLMCLVGLTFSSLGLFLASITKESTNFQLLITLVMFPLMFLSGAYIPIMAIPKILLPVVYLNPLTYTTSAFRFVALQMEKMSVPELISSGVAFNAGGIIITPLMSAMMIVVMGIVFFTLCVNRFARADFSRVKVFRRQRQSSGH